MEQVPLYASSVSRVSKEWLEATCRDAGLSLTAGLEAILTEARARNWTLRPSPAQVIEP